MSEVNLNEQEITDIKEIQSVYQNMQISLGQLGMLKLDLLEKLENLNKEEQNLSKKYQETKNKEADLLQKMNKTYGEGRVDLQKGVFIKKK
jgi:allophanate hydrolase subunit 1